MQPGGLSFMVATMCAGAGALSAYCGCSWQAGNQWHLERLSPGDVVLRLQQLRVAVEELLVIAVQELSDRRGVPRQQILRTQEKPA